jgi:hypothetical protein
MRKSWRSRAGRRGREGAVYTPLLIVSRDLRKFERHAYHSDKYLERRVYFYLNSF